MPSHKIHLSIAKEINNKLNLDLDSVMLGSVLPDICENKNHQLSHFQIGEKDFEGLANPDKFIQKYRVKLKNPVMIGYLIHILTDRFYNEYIFKQFHIYDEKNECIGIYLKGKPKLLNANLRKKIKHREFNVYDKWLINHKRITKFNDINCIENVFDIDEATFDKARLKKYIIDSNNEVDNVNIFSKFTIYNYKITNQKKLEQIYIKCIKYIIDYLNKNNIL